MPLKNRLRKWQRGLGIGDLNRIFTYHTAARLPVIGKENENREAQGADEIRAVDDQPIAYQLL
jgi:hypothetical protein